MGRSREALSYKATPIYTTTTINLGGYKERMAKREKKRKEIRILVHSS